jgi:hypothetical protein
MNLDTEHTLMEVYEALVQECINLRRVGSDPAIPLRERTRLMAMADGVNVAITHVVETLRSSQREVLP